ncbi:MAG TPA: ABC transporter substrate-binding protein [Microlunatus sp.]|nr:ABC transporter substrate-binding protein [Microlunatus sp.]
MANANPHRSATFRSLADASISRRGLLGGALGAAVGLTACGPGSAGRPGQQVAPTGDGGASGYDGPAVTLAYWNGLTGGDGPIMRKLTDQFTKANPNIKIVTTSIEWAEYFQKLPAAVSSGKGPDIGIMHADDLATNAARNVIQPLDDVAEALQLTEDDFAKIAWNGGIYDGKRYGIPLDIHPAGLYYNKTVLEKVGADPEKPPTNEDEFMTILEQCKSKGIQGFWVSALSASGLLAQTLVYQFGGFMVADDGSKVGFADEPAVKAISWLKSLIDNGYSPKNAAGDGDQVSLNSDKAAFMINGPWMTTPLKENKKLKWGCAPVPQIGPTQATWAGSHQFVLPRQTRPDENKAKASRFFVNWISQQSLGWADAGMVPARNSVRELPEFQQKKEVLEFAKEIDYIRFTPPIPGVGDVMTEWGTGVSEAMLGRAPVADALAKAAEKGNKILESNRKKYSR